MKLKIISKLMCPYMSNFRVRSLSQATGDRYAAYDHMVYFYDSTTGRALHSTGFVVNYDVVQAAKRKAVWSKQLREQPLHSQIIKILDQYQSSTNSSDF